MAAPYQYPVGGTRIDPELDFSKSKRDFRHYRCRAKICNPKICWRLAPSAFRSFILRIDQQEFCVIRKTLFDGGADPAWHRGRPRWDIPARLPEEGGKFVIGFDAVAARCASATRSAFGARCCSLTRARGHLRHVCSAGMHLWICRAKTAGAPLG